MHDIENLNLYHMDELGVHKMVLRPRKKAKLGQEGIESAAPSARLESTLFFDTIAQGIHEIFLRFFSWLLHAVHQGKRIPVSYVVELYRASGALRTVVDGQFTTLCVPRTVNCVDEIGRYKERFLKKESYGLTISKLHMNLLVSVVDPCAPLLSEMECTAKLQMDEISSVGSCMEYVLEIVSTPRVRVKHP